MITLRMLADLEALEQRFAEVHQSYDDEFEFNIRARAGKFISDLGNSNVRNAQEARRLIIEANRAAGAKQGAVGPKALSSRKRRLTKESKDKMIQKVKEANENIKAAKQSRRSARIKAGVGGGLILVGGGGTYAATRR